MSCLDPNTCNYPNWPFFNGGWWGGWGCDRPKSSNCPPSPTPPWQRAQQSPLVQVIVQNDTVNIDMLTTFLSSILVSGTVAGAVASDGTAVATFTSTAPHGLSTGQVVAITGAAHGYFNLAGVVITVTGTTTFTYAITAQGTPASDPSASAAYSSMVFCNLPNGSQQGQYKQIFVQGSQIPTTATFIISGTFAGGFTKLKFTPIGFSALLVWDGSSWSLTGGNCEILP